MLKFLATILTTFLVINGLSQEMVYDVKRAPINTMMYDEFSPTFFGNGIIFCSNRGNKSFILNKRRLRPIHSLYYAEPIDSIFWKKNRLFARELTTNYNDGPLTLNKDESTIYFSRNINVHGNILDLNENTNSLGIFSADLLDGTWQNIQPFNFNNTEYNVTDPSLSKSGLRLYFSSNNPDGKGGYDLYYTERNDSGWKKPIRLDNNVNSAYNERYPFADITGKVYFASDKPGGAGGYDIYYTQPLNGKWINPIRLDNEINSTADDYSFILDDNLNKGYLSSNRQVSEDIFMFTRKTIQFDSCGTQQENKFCYQFFDENHKNDDTLKIRYLWLFSDSVTLSGAKVHRCFSAFKKYSVTLYVISNTGDTLNLPNPMEFEVKQIKQPYITYRAALSDTKYTIALDALKTNLPDIQIIEYFWDFGHGFFHYGPLQTRTFDNSGNYRVKLGILGRNKSDNKSVKVCIDHKINIPAK